MKCKYDKCDNEAKGSSAYCSNSCRAQQSRRNKTSATAAGAMVGLQAGRQEPTGTQVGQAEQGMERMGFKKVTRPPCTPDQLTSSCLTCKDKPTCSYLHNMNSALPGEPDYLGIAM